MAPVKEVELFEGVVRLTLEDQNAQVIGRAIVSITAADAELHSFEIEPPHRFEDHAQQLFDATLQWALAHDAGVLKGYPSLDAVPFRKAKQFLSDQGATFTEDNFTISLISKP